MNATVAVNRLLEEPDDDPLNIGPLDRYVAPVAFNTDIKDILEHALFLKSQCQEAGALSPGVIGNISPRDLNRAFLRLACEELDDEYQVDTAIKRLRRNMTSIWD